MFKVILAATDGSAHGTRATEIAANIAAKYDARFIVLSVVQPGPLPRALHEASRNQGSRSPHPLIAKVPSWFDEALEVSRRGTGDVHALVEALAGEALGHADAVAKKEGLSDYATFLEHGDPTAIILEYADRENADLIVLGRRGLGSFAELMLGSVSHKVTQLTQRSCLTVK